jgi:hypothetical protein
MLLLSLALAALSQQPPPLTFIGFRAGMSVADAQSLITKAGGSLTCKKTSDSRLRECTGTMPFASLIKPFSILLSSVRDSVGVLVLTTNMTESDTRSWVRALTQDLGAPNHKTDRGVRESWQWIRRSQMLRVVLGRGEGRQLETAVTLTHGPLLDALGPPANKKPD